MSLGYFIDINFSFCDFVLFLVSKHFLDNNISTKIESLVIPGRIKSSKSGVTTSICPDLSLKIKKIFEEPTSITFSP